MATSTKSVAKRTTARRPANVETKALAASSKSEGMRMLYTAGYTVAQVSKVFDCPYAFAYGVAKRGGFAETAAKRRAPRRTAKATKPVARQPKTASKTAPKATVRKVAAKPATKPAAKRNPVPQPSATARVAAKLASKPGRPSPARRAANRKSSGAAHISA